KFGESSVDIVLSEIGGGIERAAETLTSLCERESAVFVDIAAGSLSVLDDVRTRDVMIVEDFAQSLAIVVLEPSRDWRDTRIARLLGSDGVGDTLGDEHWLAVFDGAETVDGLADAGVFFGMGGFG